jgi:hypothetical protein
MEREAKRKLYESMGYTADEIAAVVTSEERIDRMRGCRPGTYPWDLWETRAREAGVSADLVSLGRALMREFYNHGWDEELGAACGYDDDGAGLIALAMAQPDVASARWKLLLDSDGLRGEWVGNDWRVWPLERRDREFAALVRQAS